MRYEITLMDFLTICFRRRKWIAAFAAVIVGAALMYTLLTPRIYKAECRVLPPAQDGGMAAAMLSQLSGLASLAGMSLGTAGGGAANGGELMIGILRGQTVVDRIIDQFDLMTLYKKDYRLKMREKVTSSILDAALDMRSGIVTVAVLDKDPERAARMANAFVAELKNVMQSLAIGEAAQRRLFFEQQVLLTRKTLDDAEDELQRYQEKSGLVAIDPQMEAMVSSIAALREKIVAKEVELSSLRTFAKGANPRLRRAESELAALRAELGNLESEQTSPGGGAPMVSFNAAPQSGLEYLRKAREVKYAAAMYELMLKQFEAAKIDESRETMTVQIVDPATPPDYKFKPKTALIVILALILGLCLGISWALFADYFETMKKYPRRDA